MNNLFIRRKNMLRKDIKQKRVPFKGGVAGEPWFPALVSKYS
jgi:hypothetical protein